MVCHPVATAIASDVTNSLLSDLKFFKMWIHWNCPYNAPSQWNGIEPVATRIKLILLRTIKVILYQVTLHGNLNLPNFTERFVPTNRTKMTHFLTISSSWFERWCSLQPLADWTAALLPKKSDAVSFFSSKQKQGRQNYDH